VSAYEAPNESEFEVSLSSALAIEGGAVLARRTINATIKRFMGRIVAMGQKSLFGPMN
jgi:hypothetical protein